LKNCPVKKSRKEDNISICNASVFNCDINGISKINDKISVQSSHTKPLVSDDDIYLVTENKL